MGDHLPVNDLAETAITLEARDALLMRNRAIVRGNLATLDAWVTAEPRICYVEPRSGTTALLRYESDLPSESLCLRLLETEGVLFTPRGALDAEGYLRIGYANNATILREGLARTFAFLATLGG